ncbi:MAG: relaxase/mobilization nuclease domain-containing protein [Desulfovibrio sp.]|jgi:hypothetical protein|nr:relaxase/mobilization nuclease domain-containing protein [Desulfovibrio sp.]
MISKQIKHTQSGQSAGAYVTSLIDYITSPQDTHADEKCIAVFTNNLTSEPLTAASAIREFKNNVAALDGTMNPKCMRHWVLSFAEGEHPDVETIRKMTREFLVDLGYNVEHQWLAGVHDDTDHLHIHICANRWGSFSGKLLQEGKGWQINEAQKAVARLEKKYGLSVAANRNFVVTDEKETITIINPYTDQPAFRERYVVKKAPIIKTTPPIRDRARQKEKQTGIKSPQRSLQETFAQDIKPHLDECKRWADYYELLATYGVECSVNKHNTTDGLAYSLDGVHWEKAGSIGSEFSIKVLKTRFSGNPRQPREAVSKILERVRAERDPDQDLLDLPAAEMTPGAKDVFAVPAGRTGFEHKTITKKGYVEYRSEAGRDTSFIDFGNRIAVFNDLDPAAVLAALKVGQEKWGSVKVSGAADYVKLCNKLAKLHGIRITKKSRKRDEDDAPRPTLDPMVEEQKRVLDLETAERERQSLEDRQERLQAAREEFFEQPAAETKPEPDKLPVVLYRDLPGYDVAVAKHQTIMARRDIDYRYPDGCYIYDFQVFFKGGEHPGDEDLAALDLQIARNLLLNDARKFSVADVISAIRDQSPAALGGSDPEGYARQIVAEALRDAELCRMRAEFMPEAGEKTSRKRMEM